MIQNTTITTEGPMIYVACLAAYNDGFLHGRWIDAAQSAEAIEEEAKEMLSTSPAEDDAEEWAIHDYQGFEGVQIDEWTSFEKVSAIARGLKEYGEAYAVYLDWMRPNTIDDSFSHFKEAYVGEYDKASDYVYEMAEDCGDLENVPNYLQFAIDWEGVTRDCECNGDFYFSGGHVFRNI